MIGILCEKPSAARNFAKALGGMKGSYNGETYIIAHALGHLYEFVDPSEQVVSGLQAKYKSWSLSDLPWNHFDLQWKRTKKDKVNDVLNNIKATLKDCDEIVVGTDLDPSGEGFVLAYEVLEELNLLRGKKLTRMYFLDESTKEIQKAFVGRKPVGDIGLFGEYQKGMLRAKYDYLTMQFTRIATKVSGHNIVLRQGRLKSAMTVLVGQQVDAVNAYQKIPFYEHRFRDENGNVYAESDAVLAETRGALRSDLYGASSSVVVDSKTMKTSAPPKLLDLAGLSSILAGQGFKPKDVLKSYQLMYEAQIVSYPRTEDKFVTSEQFNELLPLVDKIAAVVGVDSRLLTHRQPRATHVKTGGAHGANRPGLNVPNSLMELEAKYGKLGRLIYQILAKNYLSILAEDYRYEQQKGHLEKYPTFVGVANVPVSLGYKAIFNDEDDDVNGKTLGTMAGQFEHEGFPPKPTTPTMKWLMKQLEKYECGTGATRTSTFAEVTSGKTALLSDTKGKLDLTENGRMSYLLLPDTHIGRLDMSVELQQNMKLVEQNQIHSDVVLQEVARLVREDIVTMQKNAKSIGKVEGMSDIKKEKVTGVYNGSSVAFSREYSGHRLTDKEVETLLSGKEVVLTLISKTGNPYQIRAGLGMNEYKGRSYFGIQNRGFVASLPVKFCEHVFTSVERQLLENGEEVYIEGFVSKAGKSFNAYIMFEQRAGDDAKKIYMRF